MEKMDRLCFVVHKRASSWVFNLGSSVLLLWALKVDLKQDCS